MSRSLLKNLFFVVFLAACSTASRNTDNNRFNTPAATINQQALPADTIISDFEDSNINEKASSLMDLPQTQDGEIVLSEGFYEAEFRSYCLQPGTPGPSGREAYLQAPLNSYRKDIVQTVLRNSLDHPELEQKNIQLLLWSVVSGSDFRKLSWEVQQTAAQLLTRKQIFELKGGVMGIMKDVSAAFPESGINNANNKLKQLFEMGNNSYEAYERIAVLQQSAVARRTETKQDQWYKQEDGYYLRYLPTSYQKVKIQVYVPKQCVERKSGEYLIFDPVTTMAIPAYSNSQRLGIGAPLGDILRKIILIQKAPPAPKNPPVKNKNPKTPY